jgi:hypothetical protein
MAGTQQYKLLMKTQKFITVPATGLLKNNFVRLIKNGGVKLQKVPEGEVKLQK